MTLTAEQRQHLRHLVSDARRAQLGVRGETTRHGTICGYFSSGCRCADCKAAAHGYYQARKAAA